MKVSAELINWLASGERGSSSNTIVEHLCDFPATRGSSRNRPYGPAGLGRCRKLLEQVPDLVPMLPQMATCSPHWAALVGRWQELCDTMDAEAPQWRAGVGMAPKTYALMCSLLAGDAPR